MHEAIVARRVRQLVEAIWVDLEVYSADYADFPLTNQQHAIMACIIGEPYTTPKDLARKMNISKSGVSQQLARLVAEGYVRAEKSEEDGRVVELCLEKKGIAYRRVTQDCEQRFDNLFAEKLTATELTRIEASLQQLKNVIHSL